MPPQNRFRAQTLTREIPARPPQLVQARAYLLDPRSTDPTGSYSDTDHPSNERYPEGLASVWRAGVCQVLRQWNVRRIILLHGTFAGHDALGLLHDLGQVFPAMMHPLRHWHKAAIDRVMGDAGNYPEHYQAQLARLLNSTGPDLSDSSAQRDAGGSIEVERFVWSSQNHHLARLEAAIELLDHWLQGAQHMPDDRTMLWGHSHGGNVLALITNLLAADPTTLDRVFETTRPYWSRPWARGTDVRQWPRVWQLLKAGKGRTLRPICVTFGTPVVYGWDTDHLDGLIHFIHHRPSPPLPAHLAPFPFGVEDVVHATHGDYVQQLGIAATTISPGWLQVLARQCERALQSWWFPQLRRRELWEQWKLGVRCHRDGLNVLADYTSETVDAAPVLGHAVYTRPEWIPFHLLLIAKYLAEQNGLGASS